MRILKSSLTLIIFCLVLGGSAAMAQSSCKPIGDFLAAMDKNTEKSNQPYLARIYESQSADSQLIVFYRRKAPMGLHIWATSGCIQFFAAIEYPAIKEIFGGDILDKFNRFEST